MKEIYVNISGQQWPCRPTMGAMLRFKRETGKEVTEIDGGSMADLCTYLWCCVVSAANADGKAFDLSLMDFADRLDQSDLLDWAKSLDTGNSEDKGQKGKKKVPSRS